MLNRRNLKEFLIITVGTIIIGSAVFFFMLPSQVSVGSASALAMVIGNFIPLPVSALTFILNTALLIVGFILLGHEFGIKTVYASMLLPATMRVYELLLPDFQSLTHDPVLDVLCYTLVVGMGLAMLFSCDASSGGLDIVAKIMNKYLRMDMGRVPWILRFRFTRLLRRLRRGLPKPVCRKMLLCAFCAGRRLRSGRSILFLLA